MFKGYGKKKNAFEIKLSSVILKQCGLGFINSMCVRVKNVMRWCKGPKPVGELGFVLYKNPWEALQSQTIINLQYHFRVSALLYYYISS